MGPAILVDKSIFQSLSKDEIQYLRKYYNIVFCPTLFYEILGDLKKYDNEELSKKEVNKVAYKIHGPNAYFTTDFRTLILAELLGNNIDMNRKPILTGGREIDIGKGKKGIFFEEQPEFIALRRWLEGKYSEAEKLYATNWRNCIDATDLNIAKINAKYFRKTKSLKELKEYIPVIIEDQNNQFELLQFLLKIIGSDINIRNKVCERWLASNMPKIKDFALYAYYCLSVYMNFYVGIAQNHLGTRASNVIDLEYVLYLPFCKVFTSSDIFLMSFSKEFLAEEQDFVWGFDLKKDLQSICEYWSGKSDEQRKQYRKKYGNYPPEIQDSVTCKLWKKHFGERNESFGETELTPERGKQLMETIKPILDSLKDDGNLGTPS